MGVLVLGFVAGCGAPSEPGGPTVGDPATDCLASTLPVACPGRGLYDGPVLVALGGEGALTYSVDGAPPTTPYDGPFEVVPAPGEGVVALRIAANGGPVFTHSYVFPEAVVDQPPDPPGRPASWGGTDGDYAMDPSVVGPSRADAVVGLASLPSVSIVMDPADLWGTEGIYVNPSEDGWERPASMEWIPADGPSAQIDCGIRIQGGSSTEDWKSEKLSLRVRFHRDYGPGELVLPVFVGSDVDRFDTLVLDAHLNLTWIHPEEDQRDTAQYVRDAFVADLQNAVGSLGPHSRFVHLYLDGLYWGLYDLHERPDASFAAEWLGGGEDDWDAVRHDGTLVDGDLAAWETLFSVVRDGVEDEAAYGALQQWLDVDDFVNYLLVNFYGGNTDWPQHNWYAARRRDGDTGFRFFSWDAEHVLKDVQDDATGVDADDGPGELYQALLDNDVFRQELDSRATELLADGGALGPTAVQATYEARIAEVEAAILLESARWGDNQRPGEPYTVDDWRSELERLRSAYFAERTDIARGQIPGP